MKRPEEKAKKKKDRSDKDRDKEKRRTVDEHELKKLKAKEKLDQDAQKRDKSKGKNLFSNLSQLLSLDERKKRKSDVINPTMPDAKKAKKSHEKIQKEKAPRIEEHVKDESTIRKEKKRKREKGPRVKKTVENFSYYQIFSPF